MVGNGGQLPISSGHCANASSSQLAADARCITGERVVTTDLDSRIVRP